MSGCPTTFKTILKVIIPGALALLLTLGLSPQSALGQDSGLFPRLGSSGEVGDLAYGTVRLDGRNLFEVAVKTTGSDSDQPSSKLLGVRVDLIENRLRQILTQLVAQNQILESQQIVVNKLNTSFVVQAITADTSKPLSIVTVTNGDAEIYGLPASDVADFYATRIRKALTRGYQERQLNYVVRQLGWAAMIGLAAALVTSVLVFVDKRHHLRQQHLRDQCNQISESIAAIDPQVSAEDSAQRETLRQEQHLLNRQISGLRTRTRIRHIITVVIWLIAISFGLRLFPQTRTLGVLLIRQPIWIVLLWFGIVLAVRITHGFSDRLLEFWASQHNNGLPHGQNRRQQRLPTLSKTLKGIETALLYILGLVITCRILTYFSDFELVASVGVLGVAASIGFQSLIKDALCGAMVLWQDAFTVGDVVAIGAVSGYVEMLNLMVTQLRSSGGELITISNGEISTVKNMTKEWSRMELTLEIAYDADIDKALHLMSQILATMSQEAEWRDSILEAPDILAIEALAASGITLKIRAKTAPMQQWKISREYRRRLKQQLDQAGIAMGRPQQTIVIEPNSVAPPVPKQ